MMQLRSVQRLAGRAASVLPLPSVALCPPQPAAAAAAAALTLRRFGSISCGCAISPLQRDANAIVARHFSSGSDGSSDSAAAAVPAVSGGGDSAGASQSQRRLTSQLVQLAKQADSAAAERLVAKAEATGLQPDVKAATAWLSCYDRSGEWRGAEKVWRRMAELGLVADATSYCKLMQTYLVNGEADQLAKIDPLYAEMINGSGPPGAPLQFSARDFMELIKTAHRCRLAAEARKWSERARAAGVWEQLDETTHRIVATMAKWKHQPRLTATEEQRTMLKNRLLALVPASNWKQAERLVAEAEAAGTQIDVWIINVWLNCYERCSEWRGAEKVWRRMAELNIAPNSVSYCKLMQIYLENGEADQLAKIEPLYAEMTSGNRPTGQPLQFSVRSLERLIKTAHRFRLTAEVRKWAERARAAGLWAQLDVASRHVVSTLAHWKEEDRVARHEQKVATRTEAQPVAVEFRSRLLELTTAGDFAEAERLVSEAEEKGVRMDVETFNAWLGCCCHAGGWSGAELVWHRMAQQGIAPNSASYRTLMDICAADGSVEHLAKIGPLYAEMLRRDGANGSGQPSSVKPAAATNRVADATRSRAPGGQTSLHPGQVQQQHLSPLHARMLAAAQTGNCAEAERLVAEAEAAGTQLDVKTINAWLGCHAHSGDWRGAESVWQRAAHLNIASHWIAYRTLMQVYMENGEADQLAKIEPLYVQMTKASSSAGTALHFSARDYDSLIRTAHRHRLGGQVRRWAELARATGVWEALTESNRRIVAIVAEWEQQPRTPLDSLVDAEPHQRQ